MIRTILEILILLGVLYLLYQYFFNGTLLNSVQKEGFRVRSQNFVTNNMFENADRLEYGSTRPEGLFKEKLNGVSGPSTMGGVNKNSNVDLYDNRGFRWNYNGTDPKVDSFVNNATDLEVRNKFERTYLLDPSGDVAKYDITNNKMSPNCCPAQYAPPFKLNDNNESNCSYAQKYVANNYSGMNFDSNAGCLCMPPDQATFYGNRGNNA
jgi:hypothetical protein